MKYSLPPDTPEQRDEEATYLYFIDFLEKCAGTCTCIYYSMLKYCHSYNNHSQLDGDVSVEVTMMGSQARNETVTLEDILSFTTGSTQIPIGGFPNPLHITFSSTRVLATASTCDLTLTLPTKFAENYEMFENQLVLSLKGHEGFGHV